MQEGWINNLLSFVHLLSKLNERQSRLMSTGNQTEKNAAYNGNIT